MDVVLGLEADGGGAPRHGGQTRAGAVGAPVVGPMGLLDLLETARGLAGPPVSDVVRIGAYQAILEKLAGRSCFWSRSLETDGWATARTLLRWRDELIAAGWRPEGAWRSPRLADLAWAEAASEGLPRGAPDRIAALVGDLASRPRLPLSRLRLIDQREDHPAGLRRLVDAVAACCVTVEQVQHRPAAPATSALGRLQRWLADGAEIEGTADGSVTLAAASSLALAAELTGQWFASRDPDDAVIVAEDGDTHLLDHGLAASGQPRAGRSRASPHRGSLQVLLLAFKTSWAPFDPYALMELLLLPTSPIPPRAGRRLADALERAPGRGGTEWRVAWDKIAAAEMDRAGADTALVAKAEKRLQHWRQWADPTLADPVSGMPIETALEICDRTAHWATVRHSVSNDPLHLATARLAGDVRAALSALGRTHLPRPQVERIIDQALDVGHVNPLAVSEAASWRSVTHPGAVWSETGQLVWWNFRAPDEAVRRPPWTRAERAELAAHGSPLDDLGREGRVRSAAWERALLHARDRIVFVSGGLDAEDDEACHPLAHRLAPAIRRLATKVRLEDALAAPALEIADGALPRRSVAVQAPPATRPSWPTPATFAERLAACGQSATSLENLLACQLMWALRHVAFLRPGRIRAIPDATLLHGNLAHALAQDIFQPGEPPEPDDAAESARRLMDERIDEIAAPLRLSEHAAALSEAEQRMPLAMAALARTLKANDLVVDAVETEVNDDFGDGLALRGVIDMLARDRQGASVILDQKWSRREKYRVEELEKGQAVQLATYRALLGRAGVAGAGYFMLRQRQFVTLEDSGLVGRAVKGPDLDETWANVAESWRLLRAAAEAGSLIACGVEGSDELLPDGISLRREARCNRCDYRTLCRMRVA